ncbi:MAG: isoleucine--tRNA ligase [Bacillota bacterium]
MDNNGKKTEALSFPDAEKMVGDFWKEAHTFDKSLTKEAPKGDYVFYDGPPFATGTPHYGHLVASVMKDVVPRYQTMRGYRVARKWGWDCHGLPIENIVEKELGTRTKKEIEVIGVEKFNDLCRSKVMTYAEEWETVIGRLGRWVDFANGYKTMDLDYMETIWWVFKQLWDKGLIYRDYRSMHICPRCETTLSQSEVTEGYKDIKDLSAIAKFELVEEPGTFILAWTTTPWTLVGNVALAVGADIDYLKVEADGLKYIVAEERAADVFKDKDYKVVAEISGSELVGKAYKPLFDYYSGDASLESRDRGWKVYAAPFVTTTDGTGVVHIAPAFGEDDMNLGRSENLPFVQHVALDGTFKPEVKDFAGLHVKPAADHMATDVEIIKYLAGKGTLFHKEKYEHSYPHCWRCDTPLINYATSSWFVNVTKIKDGLLRSAKEINWSPEYIKEGRFGNWLEGARDWSISRQRFWASAIPIWECPEGHRHVVSSVKELEERTGEKVTDIHKDKVDRLFFPCPECGEEMRRVSDVLDCWFESGSMPYAQLHYPFENKELFEKGFPAQFIAEGADQTRAWFYYLHVISGGVRQSHAYQNVIVNGIVLAEDGKKMSKRLQNYPDPMGLMEKYGADALRAYILSSPVMQAENLNFAESGVQEALRKNIMTLWNVYRFYSSFAAEYDNREVDTDNVLDAWILAKFKLLLLEVTRGMENYNLPKAVRPITEFIDELSTWYLRRSRDRFKSEDEKDKQAALAMSRYVLIELAKVMAPFMPYVAERLWQEVTGKAFSDRNESVHLQGWSDLGTLSKEEGGVVASMSMVRQAAEMGLSVRDGAGIKIRQMLEKAAFKGGDPLGQEYIALISDELNLRSVEWEGKGGKLEVLLDMVITPELRLEGYKRELIRTVNALRKEAGLTKADRINIYFGSTPAWLAEIGGELKKATLAEKLESGKQADSLAEKKLKLDDIELSISILKI